MPRHPVFCTIVIHTCKSPKTGDCANVQACCRNGKRTCCFSGFLAYDGGPQVFLRAAVNTNEKRNHEICFITVSCRRFCVSM